MWSGGKFKPNQDELEMLKKNENNASIYTEILGIMKRSKSHDIDKFILFRELNDKLSNSHENAVKEVCLYEISFKKLDESFAELIMSNLAENISMIFVSNSSTFNMKLYCLRIFIDIMEYDVMGDNTRHLITISFIKELVTFLENTADLQKLAVLDFMTEMTRFPYRKTKELLSHTPILSNIYNFLKNTKFDDRITKHLRIHYLHLLACLTLIDHESFSEHIDLFKLILDMFLKAKKGEIIYNSIEIIEHFSHEVGKKVIKEFEHILYIKIMELIDLNQRNTELVAGGYAILSTMMEIEENYMEKFIEDGGIEKLTKTLQRKIAIEEVYMIFYELCFKREIYRESLFDKKLLSQIAYIATSRLFNKDARIDAICRLCELFWVSSKKQSIRFLNEGLMDIIFTNCLEYKDEFLYEALARVIRKMLKMSRKGIREAKQKLYELNGMQIFEKLLAIKQRQATF